MKDLIKHLVTLQRIDTRILEKRSFIEKVPARIHEVDEPLKEAQAERDRLKQKDEALARKKKEREQALDEINERVSKMKGRMSDIKTNKEYQAHLKEIEAAEQDIRAVEDRILTVMEEIDSFAGQLRAAEVRVRQEEEKLNAFKKQLDEEIAVHEAELEGLKKERAGVVSSVDGDVYNMYMKLLSAGGGVAVTSAQNEVCSGCNMNIPPQLFVEIIKGEELISCPQCRRILYYSAE